MKLRIPLHYETLHIFPIYHIYHISHYIIYHIYHFNNFVIYFYEEENINNNERISISFISIELWNKYFPSPITTVNIFYHSKIKNFYQWISHVSLFYFKLIFCRLQNQSVWYNLCDKNILTVYWKEVYVHINLSYLASYFFLSFSLLSI